MARSRPTNQLEAEIASRLWAPRKGSEPPFDGMDRTGFVARSSLGEAEQRAVLGAFPRKSLWPDVTSLNEEVGKQMQRLTEAQARVSELLTESASAPQRDADRLAEWHLAGQRGPKPEPTADALDKQIAEAQLDAEALQRIVDHKLQAMATFVEKNRDRLIAVAQQQVTAAGERMIALVDELQHARAAVIELRTAEVWSRTYPDPVAQGEPPTSAIAGGRAAPVERLLGLKPAPAMIADRLLDLLRADARHLLNAATPEQARLIEGDNAKPSSTVWTDSDEGRAWERQQREEARQRAARF